MLVGASIFLFGLGSSQNDCDDSSESMWDKAKNMAKDFTIGTGYSLGNNMLFGIPTHVVGMNDNNLPDSISCKAGRIVGDVASIIRSGSEIAAGVGGEVGGLALDATGVGAIAGVPINVGAAALVSDGAISGYRSFNNLANDTMSLISSKGGNKPEKILGENGTQFTSKTPWQNGKTERIDVENPAPGERAGQIHYHEPNNTRWYLDIKEKQFYNQKTGELAPKKIQKLLKDKDVINAINKALKLLGED